MSAIGLRRGTGQDDLVSLSLPVTIQMVSRSSEPSEGQPTLKDTQSI
jgi:hypothetical protein